jgi:hypothetical protein
MNSLDGGLTPMSLTARTRTKYMPGGTPPVEKDVPLTGITAMLVRGAGLKEVSGDR